MYLGVLVLVALAVTRRTAASVSDGIALGIVAVVLLALASRLFFGDVGPAHRLRSSRSAPACTTR